MVTTKDYACAHCLADADDPKDIVHKDYCMMISKTIDCTFSPYEECRHPNVNLLQDKIKQLEAGLELWKQRVTFAEARRIAESAEQDYGVAAHMLRDLPLTIKAELSSLAHSIHSCGTASDGDWVGLRDLWDKAWREAICELEQ